MGFIEDLGFQWKREKYDESWKKTKKMHLQHGQIKGYVVIMQHVTSTALGVSEYQASHHLPCLHYG